VETAIREGGDGAGETLSSATRPRREVEAWLELSDGSAEQDARIEEAVREVVQLQLLFVEALCRHFPAIAGSIREVAQHLFENAQNLLDENCCQQSLVATFGWRKLSEN
jgi:hypothetical protein